MTDPRLILDRLLLVLISAFIGALGVWAVLSQIAVFAGARFGVFPYLFALAVLGGLVTAIYALRQPLFGLVDADGSTAEPASNRLGLLRFAVLGAVFAGTLIAAIVLNMPVILFSVLLLVGSWGLIQNVRTSAPSLMSDLPSMRAWEGGLLLVLVAAAVLLPMVVHRPDADDANFLNLAVGLLTDPRPALAFDTMIEDLAQPIHLPTYRVETYHVLVAVVSALTGASVIESAHLILAPALAGLLMAIFALFCRMTAGRAWLLALLVALIALVLLGLSHRSHGNFSFMRIQQGKSLLFVGIVPLVYIFAQRYWLTARKFDLVMLFLTLAAGTALSANGVFLGLIAVTLCVGGLFVFEPWRIGPVVALALASVWPVVAGLSILLTTGAYPSEFTEAIPITDDVVDVYGKALAPLFLAFCAGWVLLQGQAQRLFLGAFFLQTAIVLNPWLSPIFAEHLTGNLNWRLLFAFPLPLFVGLAVAAALGRLRWDGLRSTVVTLALLLALSASPFLLFSERNRVHVDPFGLDVPRADYSAAAALVPSLDPTGVTLAPERIATWVATFEEAPRQVAVRWVYLDHYRHTRPAEDVDARFLAFTAVSGREALDDPAGAVLGAVERFGVTDVVLQSNRDNFEAMGAALLANGFAEAAQVDVYHLYKSAP